VAFVAAHVLGAAINSGGDVLFANVAREIAVLRPEWNIAAIAPDYACDGLAPFFRTVVPLPSLPDEANRLAGHPRAVVAAWRRRIGPCEEALARLAPRIVHTTGDFFADVFPAARAKRRGHAHWTGVVHHINPPPLRRRNEITAASASWLLQLATLRALRRGCDRVLLLNEDVRARLLGRGFSNTQLAVTGAGIDLHRFALRPPPPPGRRVLWVHRLETTKGMFDLPRLAALLGDGARIDVVGRGPHAARARLEKMIDRARVGERIIFHGHVDDAALARLYANANAFVSCSYEEGWGLSIAEALAAGVPCFAYALPSHREIFGSVVETAPVGDVAALAQRIRGAFARRELERDRARRRAAVERHSFAVVAERHVTLFEQLLGTGRT
jgi:glycosyltransferase involved in cell wall biosynthesis